MKRESQQELFYAGIPTFVGSDYVEIEDCKDYDIEMEYYPVGATEGILVSCFSIAIAVILALLAFFTRKTAKNTIGSREEAMV